MERKGREGEMEGEKGRRERKGGEGGREEGKRGRDGGREGKEGGEEREKEGWRERGIYYRKELVHYYYAMTPTIQSGLHILSLTCACSILTHIAAIVAGGAVQLQCRRRAIGVLHLTVSILLAASLVQIDVPLETQEPGVIQWLATVPATASASLGTNQV